MPFDMQLLVIDLCLFIRQLYELKYLVTASKVPISGWNTCICYG